MENSFDSRATTWDENPGRIRLVNEVSDVILKEIRLGYNARMLDYGCGTGLLGYKFADRAGEIVFSDTSEGMLAQVERKKELAGYANVTIVKADLLKDDIPGSFDFIFSMLVLHHVAEIDEMVGRFAGKLNPGGVFCWIDLDEEDGSFHGDDSIPHFGFAKEKTTKILVKAGFEPFFYTNEIFMTKEVEGEKKQFPLFIVAARKV